MVFHDAKIFVDLEMTLRPFRRCIVSPSHHQSLTSQRRLLYRSTFEIRLAVFESFSICHLSFIIAILLCVRSCDFVDRFSFLSQANDPRSDTKQREINPANSSWKCNRTLFVASPQRGRRGGEMFIARRSFLYSEAP